MGYVSLPEGIRRYLDPPRGAKWMGKDAIKQPLSPVIIPKGVPPQYVDKNPEFSNTQKFPTIFFKVSNVGPRQNM